MALFKNTWSGVVGVLRWTLLILLWWIWDEMYNMPDWDRLGNASHCEQPWLLGSWLGNLEMEQL